MEDLDGKVAVVTGAASGIGRAVADALAAEGARLVLADIETDALEVAVAEVGDAGTEVIGVPTDVSDATAVDALGSAALDAFGALHLAVNNAGVAAGGPSWEIDLDTWRWVLGVDLWGVVHGVRTFTPLIVASGGGHIVNVASMAGLTSSPFMGPYNVSKHGVVTLSETLFQELALLHPEVGVTVVCPGWVRTRIHQSDRNRPGSTADGEVGDPGSLLSEMAGLVEGLVASGLDPADVAARIVEAVRERRFYVLTHADWAGAVTRRVERMVVGDDPEMMLPGIDPAAG